jgi:DNA-directed RNA polymerase specialized sigma24 family protein
MLNQLQKKYTYEDLFLERYDRMLAWAIRLTDHDLQQAEDLVHDVFVKFALTQPDLRRIENPDAYLYTALRNTYRSQVSRPGYGSVKHLHLLDFDSAELWLRRAEHLQAFQTQQELYLICRYSCVRKETAKAASVLILRYFLGYFPSEIAKILICERQAVAELLRVARVEARLFVDDPKRLSFVDQDLDLEPIKVHGALPTEELLARLRHQIFSARSGRCLSNESWKEQYLNGAGQAIERRILAHLVSCPHCLDEVNRVLGMPLLEDRNPTDSTGHDPGSKGGTGSGKTGALKRIRRQAEQVYNHDPKELRIMVDGRLLGSQEINAEVNKQTLSLTEAEPDTFIEIYSEQDLRLAYLVVEQLPIGAFEQREVVELSDERRIEISLNLKGIYPELQVAHYQPSSQPDAVSPLPSPVEEAEKIARSEPESKLSLLLNWFSQWTSLRGFRPRIAIAVGMILIAAWLIFDLTGKPIAGDLLYRAAIAEASFRETMEAAPDQVFHRTIEIAETRSDNSVVARRRVEIWQNSGKRLEVRRLYDEKGDLIAGEWKTTDGSNVEGRRLYRRGSRSQVENSSEIESKNLWRLDLSAREFVAFTGNPGGGSVEETPRAYVLSYRNPSSGLASASLTIDRRSNRAIGQQFVFRYTNEDRVVQFNEKNFQRRSLDATLEPVFDVEPELSESSTQLGQLGNTVTPSQTSPVAPPAPAALVAAITALEVKALTLLHRIGADLGEEVSLTRGDNGRLQIKAIVETSQRKNEILASLAPIAGHPATTIRVETVAEALRGQAGKRKPSTRPLIREYDATAGAIPAEPELRAYFTSRLAAQRPMDKPEEGAIDAEIRKFTIDILRRSQRALLFAYALKGLADRFSDEDLRTLDAESRAALFSMIAAHARRLSVDAAKMRAALQPIIPPDSGSDDAMQIQIEDGAGLSAAIERLFEWETAVDRDIRSAFIANSQAATAPPVNTVQLWRDILKVEKLSIEIHKKSSSDNHR